MRLVRTLHRIHHSQRKLVILFLAVFQYSSVHLNCALIYYSERSQLPSTFLLLILVDAHIALYARIIISVKRDKTNSSLLFDVKWFAAHHFIFWNWWYANESKAGFKFIDSLWNNLLSFGITLSYGITCFR